MSGHDVGRAAPHARRWGRGRSPRTDTDAERVLAVLARLEEAGVRAWLDGGWGVDALLGRQTRAHDDVDLVVPRSDLERLRHALGSLGYVVAQEGEPVPDDPGAFEYLVDPEGRQVDVHPVRFRPDGAAVQRTADGGAWILPAGSLDGRGRILDRAVPCLAAPALLLGHATGYVLDAAHRADVEALAAHFGLPVPPYRSDQDALDGARAADLD